MSRRRKKKKGQIAPTPQEVSPEVVTLGHLSPWRFSFDDGSKFDGGFGATELLITDYWTLRQRSTQLFEQNLYARGIIRRLVTNEINVGLHLEATPEEQILGMQEDALADWCEMTENRFQLWGDNPRFCDQAERSTFGAMQLAARIEALVTGDVLVVLRQDARTGLPRLQLVNGSKIQTPLGGGDPATGNEVVHGVEVDSLGRHIAFWVTQNDGSSKRLPAFGEKSGRRLAWLVYGTDKRLDDVRGKPLLSLILQSLKEIDRYRDSTQRKALVLSMLALFIKKGEAFSGTRPMTSGAVRRGHGLPESGVLGRDKPFTIAEHIPGTVIDELQQGEEPVAFQSNGTVESFGLFEEAIIQAVAWALEIPPEILTLSFNSNYSASQAGINEFKMYLNRVRTYWGDSFCQPIYIEWLLAETIAQKVQAPGLIEAWRDLSQYDRFGAWISADWAGQIKPAVDLSKLVAGYDAMVASGYITRDRAARELTGTKFSKNAQKLARENKLIAEANKPLAELAASEKGKSSSGSDAGPSDAHGEGVDGAEDAVEGSARSRRRNRRPSRKRLELVTAPAV